jgi:restriction endonuclease HindI-like protein
VCGGGTPSTANPEVTLTPMAPTSSMTVVRRTLQKWKYPPDKQDDAVELVLKQAEVLCSGWMA